MMQLMAEKSIFKKSVNGNNKMLTAKDRLFPLRLARLRLLCSRLLAPHYFALLLVEPPAIISPARRSAAAGIDRITPFSFTQFSFQQ